jgi:general secretion pathway protein K
MGKVSAPVLAQLVRLYRQLNLPPTELLGWTRLMQSSEGNQIEPLKPQTVQDLSWLGVPASSIKILEPYLTVLPQRTTINLNTASAIVIYASIPDIDLAAAQKLVNGRDQAPLQNLDEAAKQLGVPVGNLPAADVSVFSSYFEVQGRLRLGDWTIEETSLVQRTGQDVKALWRRRI